MATSFDTDNEMTVQESSLPSSQEDDNRIRLSRTTSTQTDLTNLKEPSESPAKTISPSEIPSSSSQCDLSRAQCTSPVESPAQEFGPHLKPAIKRTSKWAKQRISHAEDGWDDNTQVNGPVLEYESSVETVRRIALPARLVQLKPAAGGSWLFAKTFVDADFTAAGKLHIPPYSTKEEKSTRDNTYIFYVVEGAVEAKIHQTRYVLSPGGMFMVPRGNHYSLANISERAAKLVFFQSRQVTASARDTDDPIKLSTESAVSVPQFPTSKASILLGLILERLVKLFGKYRVLVFRWYLRTSFNVARHITRPRAYILCFLLGFFLRRLPFTGASRIRVQIIRPIP